MSEAGGGGGRGLDSRAVRQLFPYLEEVTYLNTATTGLSWLGQGAAAARFYDQHKARGYSAHLQWRGQLERTRELLAQVLRVPAEEISFASSATEALNGIAHGMRLQPGDEVVMCEDEFPSIALSWTPAALQGAELVRVPIEREESRTDALIARITDRTRVVSVSHVHWGTGTRVDVNRIAAATRKVGARLHCRRRARGWRDRCRCLGRGPLHGLRIQVAVVRVRGGVRRHEEQFCRGNRALVSRLCQRAAVPEIAVQSSQLSGAVRALGHSRVSRGFGLATDRGAGELV